MYLPWKIECEIICPCFWLSERRNDRRPTAPGGCHYVGQGAQGRHGLSRGAQGRQAGEGHAGCLYGGKGVEGRHRGGGGGGGAPVGYELGLLADDYHADVASGRLNKMSFLIWSSILY